MRKKILIGSLFVLALILTMPSIPAIQQKTIEDKAYSDFIEDLKHVDFDDIEVLDPIKHPILYEFVYLIYSHREMRLSRVVDIAVEYGFGYFEVVHPLLLIWAYWLGITSAIWLSVWHAISSNLGWGWFEGYE